ncbi:MAG: hypothetical protein Q8Q08_04820 [Candidatus Omnitrophota bacterium]|nr:hypothetical protein [Candidatus Omnitrophota bacterium]MDZ4242214.1 hypothetical protein [Candidatus Omnitrophota bacterium]
MNKPVILVGIGEMGGVFARGLLKTGYPVYPVTRAMNLNDAAREIAELEAVVVGVGEKDLPAVLEALPSAWREKLILLQNELLPRDWTTHGLHDPTVISVWFEKKPGQDFKVLIPSPVFGPQAGLVHDALGSLGIPCTVLPGTDALLFELVLKNLYILTINISGLVAGGTVQELWSRHQDLARAVANDVLDVQEWLTGRAFNREKLVAGMLRAFDGDPQHKCLGRTASARLERALQQAREAGLAVRKLHEIADIKK